MISVILPFYNADQYLTEAIDSVINQSIDSWELLLINDGSTDNSKKIALSYEDRRIRYFEQENQGVSSARNRGLANMKGDFFCFLDADDIIPNRSLESRYKLLMSHPFLTFADGRVCKYDSEMSNEIGCWKPIFNGNPLIDLVQLTGYSFLGLTWMIRRDHTINYHFNEEITHAEDLLFFLQISKSGGKYAFTNETILHYRDTPNSAMNDLRGLEKGYRFIEKEIKNWQVVSYQNLGLYKFRYRKAMFLAYLRNLEFINAFKAIF